MRRVGCLESDAGKMVGKCLESALGDQTRRVNAWKSTPAKKMFGKIA